MGMSGKTKKYRKDGVTINKVRMMNKTWNDFSKFIRMRDCKWVVGGVPWWWYCITQKQAEIEWGKKALLIHYKKWHAGHFLSRKYKSIMFDEKNVHFQSVYDNTYWSGEQLLYWKAINRIYGDGTAEELDRRRWQELKNRKIYELEELRKECKRAIKEIEKIREKNLKKGIKDVYIIEYDIKLFNF